MVITDFKNKHKGERCYILGNGPGLNDIDLDGLEGIVFGTNRLYLSGYTPDYYVCINSLVLEQFQDDIDELDTIRFIRDAFARDGDMPLNVDSFTPIFGNPEGSLWGGHTVTYACLQLAYYMGFGEVILLGIDFYYDQIPEENKEIVSEGDDVNHFHPDYFGKGIRWHTADIPRSELAYILAKRVFEQDGRQIVNCSTRTKLDVFPVLPLKHYLAEKPPRVSALVSAYKSEEFYTDCIKDLMQQTLWDKSELEIVVICQRGSWEHEQVKTSDIPLTVVVTKDLPSVFEAWNRGAKAAHGEYLTYANTDDRHDPTAFEIAADIMDARPEIDLTYHDSFITWKRNQGYEEFKRENDGVDLVVGRVQDKPGIFVWPEYSLDKLKQGCFMGPQPMWRANLHQKYGYFHPDFPIAGDYEFWLRFAKEDNIYHIPCPLGLYLARWDGVEMGNKEESQRQAREALKLHYGPKLAPSKNGDEPDRSVLGALPIRAWPWPRILVHIPMFPSLPFAADVFYDFMAIATQGPAFVDAGYNKVELAREKGCQKLMDSDFTHILMLDADHKHPHDIIQRLARWVIDDPEKLIIGGLNFRRGEPYDPCAFVNDEKGGYGTLYNWSPGLVKVDYIGMGSVLIAREALEQIEKPWFHFHYPDGKADNGWYSEDVHFCRKANAVGIQIYCDTTTTSPHMISAYVDENTFRNYVEQNKDKAEIIPNPKRNTELVKE